MNTEKVEKLIEQASSAKNPLNAMQFAQAALNAANALRVLVDTRQAEDKTKRETAGAVGGCPGFKMERLKGRPMAGDLDNNQEMQEAEIHPMDEAAVHAIAQGWCEPETSHQTMDSVLAMAIAKPVGRLVRHWYDTAAQHARNEEYYRGLVQEIGAMFGEEAFISDDGSVQEDILCAKVPELVRAHLKNGVSAES